MKIQKIISMSFFNNRCDWCAKEIKGKIVTGGTFSTKHYCSKKCKSEAEG